MAGKLPWIVGQCRMDTSAGTAVVRSQSGMFDVAANGAAAWSRVALGRYRCTLASGTGTSGIQIQNSLDQIPTNISVTCEDTRTDRILVAHVTRTSQYIFDVVIFGITTVPAAALADPDTGFAVLITVPGPVGV